MNAVTKPSFHLRSSLKAPSSLRDLPGWLIWRIEHDETTGKNRKVPYYANREKRHGRNGDPADRGKLVTFAAAVNAASRHGYDGVGLALLPDFNLTILDFDDCVHGGELDTEVAELISDTYAEFSHSGSGVHAIYRGALPNKKSHANAEQWGFETFSTKGFVTFSGNVLDVCSLLGNEDTIAPLSPAVRALYDQRFGKRERPEGAEPSAERLGVTADAAREWLSRIDPDVGYDEWLRAGMALHHEFGDEGLDLWDEWSSAGSKYKGSDSLITHWRSFGRGDGPPITMRSVAKLAGVTPGGTVSAEEFDNLVEQSAPTEAAPSRFVFEPAHLFAQVKASQWWVKGVLPKATLAVVYGASGSGKSFAVLDMAFAIARGEPWRNNRTRQGRVAYIAAEGADGFRKRLAAYGQHHEVDLQGVPLMVMGTAPNLLEAKDSAAVAAAVKAAGGADIIIVDTFAQVTPGANENASEDVGKALAHAKRIAEATGAMVLLVHHAGKDAARGARGWSGLRAAADAEIEVVRTDNGSRYMRLSKSKDGEDGQEWGFELLQVTLGMDEDGDAITSCVVREAEVNKAKGIDRKLGDNERLAVQVLQEFAKDQLVGIEVKAVAAEMAKRMAPPEDGKRDTRKQRAEKSLESLCKDDAMPYRLRDDGTIDIL